MKVKVTERALVQRINRILKKDTQGLKKSRKGQWHNNTGDYFIVDFNKNTIVATDVDLEKLGRELRALKGYEELEG